MEYGILYELFEKVRKDQPWVNLGLEEYFLLLDVLQSKDISIENFDDLANVIELIWLKSYQHRIQFRRFLEERRTLLDQLALALADKKVPVAGTPSPGYPSVPEVPTVAGQEGANRGRGTQKEKEQPKGTETRKKDDSDEQPEILEPEFGETGFSLTREQAVSGQELDLHFEETEELPLLEIPYLFTQDYLPVKSRHLQQAWRNLWNENELGISNQINIPKTIQAITRKGFFSQFEYDRYYENQLRLYLLIDQSKSMVAEEEFGDQLARTAILSDVHPQLIPYYFYQLPAKDSVGTDYVVTNKDWTESKKLARLFAPTHRKNIVVMIYSDAGSLDQEYERKRVEDTHAFLDFLMKRTAYVAWVNPAPRDRWGDTNAGSIREKVPMFETDRIGIENAIASLRGKAIIQQAK